MNSLDKIPATQRTYNKWVANETLEDFALRFTAKRARRWSVSRIANTALGTVSFLVLEALGGTITLSYGFTNSLWAILVVCLCLFLTGLPISYYAAKYGVDVDLLTRGAGFGYIGSTISSLIYASFTFIFFALEATIMSMALKIIFGIPLPIAYVISSLLVIPLVTHGITMISRFQIWTQPFWIILQILPFVFILQHSIVKFDDWVSFPGLNQTRDSSFNILLFGAASAVLFSLAAQIGEQVDFLRFLPEKTKQNRVRWWTAMIIGGPGWVIFGVIKLLFGSFLAYLALRHGIEATLAADPTHMYLVAFNYVTQSPEIALALAGIFVILSQLKINVANAYAGSLAWSNFFSRLTHHHPGRVVWVFFNVSIALLLMEMGAYQALEAILKLYSALVLAWIGTLVADLVINKPLGLSPKHIEFKRSHLYDINPVGVISMLFASLLGIISHLGFLGETAQALSSFIAMLTPFIVVPLVAILTKSRYYLAREDIATTTTNNKLHQCSICENSFDNEDTSFCPAYQGNICSLCCCLDSRCGDLCRPQATASKQILNGLRRFIPENILNIFNSSLGHFIGILVVITTLMASVLLLIYFQTSFDDASQQTIIFNTLIKVFFLLLIIIGVLIWLYVLSQESLQLALKESMQQTKLLSTEMSAHGATYEELQKAKETAEAANNAKSRYLTGISHELRTPLNVVLGYAQILENNEDIPQKRRESIGLIKQNGEHLANLIEGLLEISKIEAGRLEMFRDEVRIKAFVDQVANMFRLQAEKKGLSFSYDCSEYLPDRVITDEKRLRQILVNLLSNAIKFTKQGSIDFIIQYRSPIAKFIIKDTGVGIDKSDYEKIFEPFERAYSEKIKNIPGTGLGLAISKLLAELMGGEISISGDIEQGSVFTLTLMLTEIQANNNYSPTIKKRITGYEGQRKTIMVVDDDHSHRRLINDFLSTFGFIIFEAENAEICLNMQNEINCDLYLLDIFMPGMDGWELSETLRQQGVHEPIFMLSANVRDIEHGKKNALLYNQYLSKPIQLDELLEKIGLELNLNWIADKKLYEDQSIQRRSLHNQPIIDKELNNRLRSFCEIGYMSAILDELDEIEKEHSVDPQLIIELRQLVSAYDFSKIIDILDKNNHDQ